MSELGRRLAALPPDKRRLLELRLEREGLAGAAAPELEGAADAITPERAAQAAPPSSTGRAAIPGRAGGAAPGVSAADPDSGDGPAGVEMSLFFFSADGSTSSRDKYRLLLDSARFADREGFTAVWTPERHFQDFGGLYPNPSVLGAALAVATERIGIRAGSVVLPLHHPVRMVEEWSVVDNLSGGRAGVSLATGWHPEDFVLRPETYADRREVMFRDLELIRRLWAGEPVRLPGGTGEPAEVRVLPRPVQPELPLWITSSGNPETWSRAGEAGAGVLAQMGSQPIEDLARKIALYRDGRRRGGHDPTSGTVTLMLHTYLSHDPEAAREQVRASLSEYLRTHMRQRDSFLHLPAITEADREALIPLAFDHYVGTASLIGTPKAAGRLLRRLARIGVGEIACLIDFGLDPEAVLAGLPLLADLRRAHAPAAPALHAATAAAAGGGE